ncbi:MULTISPECIES: hypothetical protein [unclassified Duganella]|uniref:hypothetical protein n=1 Tax=unclassified Duganella TaxID=2636909 RepID=UPI0008752E79|nr:MULTISPECIES: hypothetical protein [unclassified Duganella]OEZ54855.1 hypothetical protein DUGA6_56260 [Duganella sp. HH105]OFA00182.1 hypothetical protein DUGA2_50150 [Duganella sp. HH101]
MDKHDRRSRRDRAKAALVDTGIAMLKDRGQTAAGAFLLRERLPFRVIVRVLAEPGQRRPPR